VVGHARAVAFVVIEGDAAIIVKLHVQAAGPFDATAGVLVNCQPRRPCVLVTETIFKRWQADGTSQAQVRYIGLVLEAKAS
jgi:hypothetical protein